MSDKTRHSTGSEKVVALGSSDANMTALHFMQHFASFADAFARAELRATVNVSRPDAQSTRATVTSLAGMRNEGSCFRFTKPEERPSQNVKMFRIKREES